MTMFEYLDELEGFSWYNTTLTDFEKELLDTYDLEDFQRIAEGDIESLFYYNEALSLYQKHKNDIWKCGMADELANAECADLFEVRMVYYAIESFVYQIMEAVKEAKSS